jgi:superfamily II DNA/RNA helicase
LFFTRTKYGAKALARQLNKSGVPTVELHGNLGQGARTRNLDAFHAGTAAALVATDIAARGIHVDDVTLVVHADPPTEHKAYLHRSGRTARAGNAGTVVTLMTSEQVRDVRDMTKAAGIKPTMTRIQGSSHPVLRELAPGERTLTKGLEPAAASPQTRSGGGGGGGRNRRRRSGGGGGTGGGGNRGQRSAAPAATSAKSGSKPSGRRRQRGGSAPRGTSSGGHSAASFSSGRH